MTEPLLELGGVTLGYGGRAVLSGVDLTVGPGTVLRIMGPNGAGKTTLLRGLLGLLRPLAGNMEVRTDRVGYVPQRESLDPLFPLTVGEVVEMGCFARLRGWRRPSQEDRSLVLTSLERVGLAGAGSRTFDSLSGGQRQRVLLARALVMRPAVLLLDEPTSGVDAETTREIYRLLEELAVGEGIAILLVSHQVAPNSDGASEVLWVADGTVTRGRLEDLLSGDGLGGLLLGGGLA